MEKLKWLKRIPDVGDNEVMYPNSCCVFGNVMFNEKKKKRGS